LTVPGYDQLHVPFQILALNTVRHLHDGTRLNAKPLRFRRVPAVPTFISDNYDDTFQREYPQLAVAIGGVLPVLDEKSRMEVYMGSPSRPGPLSGYYVTGT
jgi:hypothetical protein